MEHFKRIDILVNNAGIGAPNPVEHVTEKDFDVTRFFVIDEDNLLLKVCYFWLC